MFQLHKIMIAICAGYVCTMLCHQLPVFGSTLTPRTKSITDALIPTQEAELEEVVIPDGSAASPIAPEADEVLAPEEIQEATASTAESATAAVATPTATAVSVLVTDVPKETTPVETTTTATTTETVPVENTASTTSETEIETETVSTTEEVQPDDASEEEVPVQDALESDSAAADLPSLFGDMDTSFKTYMDYRAISDTSSAQYALQQQTWTDDQGLRRIGDDYLVAMGTGWLEEGCGERFLVTLDSGVQFTVTVGDIKADCDTDATCRYRDCDGGANVIEFIVDTESLSAEVRDAGTISAYAAFAGNIADITAL
ncbi:MAG: hypothetical protein LUC50_03460 [Ruminococcus sp.]|nr:hypothetical protein [Ruminococcus sp.]